MSVTAGGGSSVREEADLPKYGAAAEHDVSVSSAAPQGSRIALGSLAAKIPWVVLVLIGVALVVAPIRLGMYQDTAEGAALVRNFTPLLTQERLDRLDVHLRTVEAARTELAGRDVPAGNPDFANIRKLIAEFPQTKARFGGWTAAMRADTATFAQFKALPSFGVFPFVFGLAGLVLLVVGGFGLAAGTARKDRALWAVAALSGAALVVFPITTGLFAKAPSGEKLLADFGPILTDDNLRWAQDQFIVLGPAAAELQTSYLPVEAAVDPQLQLPASTAFLAQWPTISSDFAQVIGAFADNTKHFQALGRLDAITRPFGFGAFDEFGWFYVVPGALVLVLAGVGALGGRNRNNKRKKRA